MYKNFWIYSSSTIHATGHLEVYFVILLSYVYVLISSCMHYSYSDLVVGAPFHGGSSKDDVNVGEVFVYLSNKTKVFKITGC